MTQDDLTAYCRNVLAEAQHAGLDANDIITLAGYLATCALNLAPPRYRKRALREFIANMRHVLELTQPFVDAVHESENVSHH